MAELTVEGDQVVVTLSRVEKLDALHGSLRFPRDRVRAAEVIDRPIAAVPVMRKERGVWIPGRAAVGTFARAGERIFAVVRHGTPRGLRLQLEEGPFDEIVLGLSDPEAALAALQAVAPSE